MCINADVLMSHSAILCCFVVALVRSPSSNVWPTACAEVQKQAEKTAEKFASQISFGIQAATQDGSFSAEGKAAIPGQPMQMERPGDALGGGTSVADEIKKLMCVAPSPSDLCAESLAPLLLIL